MPWLTDGDISIFESGAILLHLGERSEALMPRDPKGRAEVIEWLFAALNSVEMASLPWSLFKFSAHPATRDYLKRATARPAFVKAHADQIAHFAEADT